MILETLPEVQALTHEEKMILTLELLEELNAPPASSDQEAAILEVLNARHEAYLRSPSTVSSWEEARARLQAKTGATWRK